MSDYASSLPVRTENNGDVVSAICDGTLSSQKLAIDASGRITVMNHDGAGNALTSQANGTQQALDVGINVAGVQIDPRSIRALTSSDVVSAVQSGTWNITNITGTISLPTGAATAANQATEIASLASIDGKLAPLGQALMAASMPVTIASDQSALAITAASLPLPTGAATETTLAAINAKLVSGTDIGDVTVNNGSGAAAVNIQDGGNSITVDATALDIRPLTSADVVSANIRDAAGTAFSASNPLPVTMIASLPGTDVLDYATSSSVAAGASINHDYTVTALKTLSLQQISASGSGKIKVEMKIAGSTKVVKFNSTASANIDHSFNRPQEIAAGTVVRVTITNLDKAAQDVYSTIEGYEY